MTASGDAAEVYWLNVERHQLKKVTANRLVAAIRRLNLTILYSFL